MPCTRAMYSKGVGRSSNLEEAGKQAYNRAISLAGVLCGMDDVGCGMDEKCGFVPATVTVESIDPVGGGQIEVTVRVDGDCKCVEQ